MVGQPQEGADSRGARPGLGEGSRGGGIEASLGPCLGPQPRATRGSAGLTVQENSGAWPPPWVPRAVSPWLSLRDLEASAATHLVSWSGNVKETICSLAFPPSNPLAGASIGPRLPHRPLHGGPASEGLHTALAEGPPIPGCLARSHLTSCSRAGAGASLLH